MDQTVEFTMIEDGLKYCIPWREVRSVRQLERGCRLNVESEIDYILVEQTYDQVINRINTAIVRDRELAE